VAARHRCPWVAAACCRHRDHPGHPLEVLFINVGSGGNGKSKFFTVRPRMLIAPETSQDERLDEELVKNLTGGDKLRARRMREDEWSFSPTHTAFIHTHYRPRIRGMLIVDDTRAITPTRARVVIRNIRSFALYIR
jgi:hypothetical protein